MKDYDADKLAKAVRTKRWIENDLTMVQAGKEIGISGKAVCKAENKKGLSKQTFNLICNWLGKQPGEFEITASRAFPGDMAAPTLAEAEKP